VQVGNSMTFAYWCVLAGALIPILWTIIAKWGGPDRMPTVANRAPREFLSRLQGRQQRANWAQLNAFEAFPTFAAAVIIAHVAGGSQIWIDRLAGVWVAARLAHGLFYVMDWASMRSFAYFAGIGCVIGLFIVAA
jgi:uncharacterized MAPEG superfamily protein